MKFCEQKRPGRTNLVIIRFYGIFQLVRSASGYLTICFQYVPVRFSDELCNLTNPYCQRLRTGWTRFLLIFDTHTLKSPHLFITCFYMCCVLDIVFVGVVAYPPYKCFSFQSCQSVFFAPFCVHTIQITVRYCIPASELHSFIHKINYIAVLRDSSLIVRLCLFGYGEFIIVFYESPKPVKRPAKYLQEFLSEHFR